jgi:CxxC motif-containing protein (DUF1111 family)
MAGRVRRRTASLGRLLAGCAAIVATQLALSATDPAERGQSQPWLTSVVSADAYLQPLSNLDPQQNTDFADGARAFARRWRPGLGSEAPWGLGPLANAESCIECHAGKGRTPPQADGQRLRSMVVRLSLAADPTEHGQALPHPVYGYQLNDLAVLGVPAEGHAVIEYDERPVAFADGTRVSLRAPRVRLEGLNYGPIESDTLLSIRAAPAVLGVGLLESVPPQALLDRAAEQRSLGLKGRVSHVWDAERQAFAVGRFGRKATQPDLLRQSAAAFHDDIGVTSALFRRDNCSTAQSRCLEASRFRVTDPELPASTLSDVALYLRAGAVPARRDVDAPLVRRGERLFDDAGCAACHQPTLRAGPDATLPQLANAQFHAYTDLLLHDLGADLADVRLGVADVGSREWRTAPLWGLGLAERVNPGVALLHDGRARSVIEAILWHGGEAEASREAVRAMPRAGREALLAFLNSL